MASMVTPTSANTAAHMLTTPNAPNSNIRSLMPMANTMFCFTMLNVLRAIIIPSTIFMGLSFINTMSAASIAASLPTAPHGNAYVSKFDDRSIIDAVADKSDGRPSMFFAQCLDKSHLVYRQQLGMELIYVHFPATSLATSLRSPVSMIVFPTPEAFSLAMVSADCGFRLSETTIYPI